jgi:hypothetical protein
VNTPPPPRRTPSFDRRSEMPPSPDGVENLGGECRKDLIPASSLAQGACQDGEGGSVGPSPDRLPKPVCTTVETATMSFELQNAVYKSDLPLVPKALLAYLAFRANGDNTCWPSWETICADTGMSRAALFSNLKKLSDYLKVTKRKHGLCQYEILAESLPKRPVYEKDPSSAETEKSSRETEKSSRETEKSSRETSNYQEQPRTNTNQHTATCAGSDLFTDTAVDPDEVRSNPNPAPAESHPKPHRATRRSDSMPKPDKPPRERNPLFDALVDVCQLNPATDGARYGKAIKALLALPEPPTPDEIRTKFPPYWSDRCSGTGFSGPPSPEKVASLFSIARAFKGRKQPVKPLPANMIEPDDEWREQLRVAGEKQRAESTAKAMAALRERGEL